MNVTTILPLLPAIAVIIVGGGVVVCIVIIVGWLRVL